MKYHQRPQINTLTSTFCALALIPTAGIVHSLVKTAAVGLAKAKQVWNAALG